MSYRIRLWLDLESQDHMLWYGPTLGGWDSYKSGDRLEGVVRGFSPSQSDLSPLGALQSLFEEAVTSGFAQQELPFG